MIATLINDLNTSFTGTHTGYQEKWGLLCVFGWVYTLLLNDLAAQEYLSMVENWKITF